MDHAKDHTAECPYCHKTALQRYDATQLMSDPSDGKMYQHEQYTCTEDSGGCGQTYSANKTPRPDKSLDDDLEVLDLRNDPERAALKARIEAMFKK